MQRGTEVSSVKSSWLDLGWFQSYLNSTFQYLKASWFNEIGLNTNFNMKREYLSAEEIAANTDVLLPLVDDMLYNRERACDRINAMFGTNISVHKNSAWENKMRESEAELAAMEEQTEEGGSENDKEQSSNSSD